MDTGGKPPESGDRMRLNWLFPRIDRGSGARTLPAGTAGGAGDRGERGHRPRGDERVAELGGQLAGGTNVVISGTGFTGAAEGIVGAGTFVPFHGGQ